MSNASPDAQNGPQTRRKGQDSGNEMFVPDRAVQGDISLHSLARIAYEAAAASLAEAQGRGDFPAWEDAIAISPATEAGYHAVVRAVVEAIAGEVSETDLTVYGHRIVRDLGYDQLQFFEISLADYLRGIVGEEVPDAT